MTGSKLCTDGGTYGDQDIKRTGLDQEKHYSARQCKSLALVIQVQQGLAILPFNKRASSKCRSEMLRTYQLLVAIMDVAKMLVNKDNARLLTWAKLIIAVKSREIRVPSGAMNVPTLATNTVT